MSKQTHDDLIERAASAANGLSNLGQDSDCEIIEALITELQRKDAVIERLGDDASFTRCPDFSFTNYAEWYTKEIDAMQTYARDNRYPED